LKNQPVGVEKVEVLPYHRMGESKWRRLGIRYPLEGTPEPDEEAIERAYRLIGEGRRMSRPIPINGTAAQRQPSAAWAGRP
jgi:pyruvate-formate lyase-activating enzyme